MESAQDFARTVMVTGGAGFIGSNFIRLVLAERSGARVVNVDALTYAGCVDNLTDVQGDARYTFVRADVRDAPAMAQVFERFAPDAVVHFAAESHVDRSIADPSLFQSVNVGGTAALLEAARAAWACRDGFRAGCRFLHVSTDEVYGDLPLDPCCSDGSDAFREDAPLRPRSPYAASKAAAEMFVGAYGATYGLPIVTVRCSNNYGLRQHAEKLIPKTIERACAGLPVPLYGSGSNVRDWLYVQDCCRGVLAALEKGRAGHVYNLGGGCALPNVRLVEAVRDALHDAGAARAAAFSVEHVADRPGHDRRYAMNCEKAAAELGWRPTTPFEEGMRATVAWYLERAGVV